MANELHLPDLLSRLTIDTSEGTASIRRLHTEAEALRRQSQPARAIAVADQAVGLAHDARQPDVYGLALLHRSLARLNSPEPGQAALAVRDSERAITSFGLYSHNGVVARLFRAQLEWDLAERADDPSERDRRRRAALRHFQEARMALGTWAADLQMHGQHARADEYDEWCQATDAAIEELSSLLTAPQVVSIPPKQARPRRIAAKRKTKAGQPPIRLPQPTRLVWPDAAQPDRLVLPIDVPFVVEAGRGAPQGREVTVDRFVLAGGAYALRSVTPGSRLPHLTYGRPYVVARAVPNGQSVLAGDEFALVRWGDQSPGPDEKIVVESAPGNGGRHWTIRDGTEKEKYQRSDLRIIGVLDAVLTPAAAPQPDSVDGLMNAADDLRRAEAATPDAEMRRGLAAIRDKIQAALRSMGLEPLPIVPGATRFDPVQGHAAVGEERDAGSPDGVILRIVQDGYRQQGSLVREAKVIVNRHS